MLLKTSHKTSQSKMLLKHRLTIFFCEAAILNNTAVKISFIVLLEKIKIVQQVMYCRSVYYVTNTFLSSGLVF